MDFVAVMHWRNWSTLDLGLMLISAMQHSPSPAAHFTLAFHYFDEDSPLHSFLSFHQQFLLSSDYEESKRCLHDFRLGLEKVCAV